MVNMQKSYHRSFESFPYKIFRLTASFHIFQMLSLHSIWWIWKVWYWISYKSWILFRWTHKFSMVNMQKSYHRSFESFPYKIFRLTASFHIFQMPCLHSIWWIWKAWYWISYKSCSLFRWTHNFSMINMQKNHLTDHLSLSPTKSSSLLLCSTSSRYWACTRFGGYERLGIESVTSHVFCSDGPTTFQWLTCRRIITDHLSHFPRKSSG